MVASGLNKSVTFHSETTVYKMFSNLDIDKADQTIRANVEKDEEPGQGSVTLIKLMMEEEDNGS